MQTPNHAMICHRVSSNINVPVLLDSLQVCRTSTSSKVNSHEPQLPFHDTAGPIERARQTNLGGTARVSNIR